MIEINKIYNEDCRTTMDKMPDNFVNLVVTSPPYDSLRTYNDESSWNFDIFKEIANRLYRVMSDGGVIVWVVNDETIDGDESGTSFRQALYFKEIGFKLHDTMIYEKLGFSNPSSNRYHQIFEYMFVFVKGKLKTFNPIKDKKNTWVGSTSFGKNTIRQKDGSLAERKERNVVSEYGMRYNIWKIKTSAQENPCVPIEHPATFSEEMANDHIISWSNAKDLVYDPFTGSGTTPYIAKKLGRHFIGSEISEKYFEIADKRIFGNRNLRKFI